MKEIAEAYLVKTFKTAVNTVQLISMMPKDNLLKILEQLLEKMS
jgi:hypothetical protein